LAEQLPYPTPTDLSEQGVAFTANPYRARHLPELIGDLLVPLAEQPLGRTGYLIAKVGDVDAVPNQIYCLSFVD
jgi:hypothetical protein